MIDFGEVLKGVFGGKKAEQPPVLPQQPQPEATPSVQDQIAQHQATIQSSEDMLKQVSMDPTPLDRPIIEQHQANIAQAKEAISNLTPQTPTPEPPPPGMPQIPVAPQTPEQPIVGPVVAQPSEEQKAA